MASSLSAASAHRQATQTPDMSSVDVFARQGPFHSEHEEEEHGSHSRNGSDTRHQYNHVEEYDTEDEDDFEYDAHSSAFTNPSWYGSPSMRRDSVAWNSSAATSPASPSSVRKPVSGALSSAMDTSPVPPQVATYRDALAKMRQLLVDGQGGEQEENTDHALPGSHGEIARNSGTGAMVSRRWSPGAAAVSIRSGQTSRAGHVSKVQKNSSSARGYAPTDAATFDDLPTYKCATCGITLALQDELISKAFSGRDGKAFLFFSVLNARVGPKEDRHLITGLHTVSDLTCACCDRPVGWTYVRAYEASQRYKEGKYILERVSLHKANHW